MKKLCIYFGHALLAAPEDYKTEMESFKDKFRKIPWIHVFEFCQPPPGEKQSKLPPGEVYRNDIIEGVGGSHVVMGDLSHPSTGLGGELMAGIKDGTRTMLFAKNNLPVSRLWLGAAEHNLHVSLHGYEDSIHELFEKVIDEFKTMYDEIEFKEILDS